MIPYKYTLTVVVFTLTDVPLWWRALTSSYYELAASGGTCIELAAALIYISENDSSQTITPKADVGTGSQVLRVLPGKEARSQCRVLVLVKFMSCVFFTFSSLRMRVV
jgi:hypothetical protein